ncbi:MAG: hypothetical protein ACD_76C00084G0001 [uncultured bacterium]|nr:MAG: hypothetical protein ACD_76C00084G0001 [uncultured bacterium]HBD05548.1 agmatinase [Candidatus Uhrbacteria bacterium]
MPNEVPNNFGGLEKRFCEYKNAKFAILPIPFDKTSTWGKGADMGPGAIIDASRNMELYDIETNSEPYRAGIYTADPIIGETSEEMIASSESAVSKLLDDGKFVISIGGEHSVSNGLIRAYAKKYPNLSILHLDAHSDRRDSYDGSKFSHASIMARAGEIVSNIVSVGIRSMDASEVSVIDPKKIFYAENIIDSDSWMKSAIDELSENVYITIDLDVFDPSALPSTGTPEPGGMDWYQVIRFLKLAVEKKNIVGCDIVELAPNPDEKSSDFLAAKLIYKLIAYAQKI